MRRASLLAGSLSLSLSLAVAAAEERPSCSRRKAHKEISRCLIRQRVTSWNNCFLRNDFVKKPLRAITMSGFSHDEKIQFIEASDH